jgi:anti-sigma regulatory factor (Ser/Thr protein kinase)
MQDVFRSFPCQVEALPVLRLALEQWLSVGGVDAEAMSAAVLATHEAAANAGEHSECDDLEVDGRLEARQMISIEVRDGGGWKTPQAGNDERGRGLQLIHGLMENVTVNAGSLGTSVRMRPPLQTYYRRRLTEPESFRANPSSVHDAAWGRCGCVLAG